MRNLSNQTVLLEHSGGTKFYQLFRIHRQFDDTTSAEVTVAHYGPIKSLSDARPISGGQTKIYPGSAYESLLQEKKSVRNGGFYEETGRQHEELFVSEGEFRSWLTHTFPTRARDQILSLLVMSVDPDASPTPYDDRPSAELETINSAPKEVPIGWGDW